MKTYTTVTGLIIMIITYSCTWDVNSSENLEEELNIEDPNDITDGELLLFCDTANYSYDSVIVPLITQNCASSSACHGSGAVFGDYTGFQEIKADIDNGSFYDRVYITGDMPPTKPLTDCDSLLLLHWLNNGILADTIQVEDPVKEDPVSSDCDPEVIYFEKDVLPILQSNCALSGCHDNLSKEDGFDFSTYESTIRKGIKPGDPEDSELFDVITLNSNDEDIMPPSNMEPLTDQQIQVIETWILQGALDLTCNEGNCDITNVTFSATVFPIIENKCKGCHNGSNAKGNVSLTNYTEVAETANNGSLLGTIRVLPGYSQMPTSSLLPECEILQIEKWIEEGAKDN
jgi:hypothetical protein